MIFVQISIELFETFKVLAQSADTECFLQLKRLKSKSHVDSSNDMRLTHYNSSELFHPVALLHLAKTFPVSAQIQASNRLKVVSGFEFHLFGDLRPNRLNKLNLANLS